MSLNRKARRQFEKNTRSGRTKTVGFATAGSILATQASMISPAAAVSTQVVTSCEDSGAGTLRAAITSANLDPDLTDISFALSSSCDTITLAAPLDLITTSVDIQGPGANLLTIDGIALDSSSPVFDADSGSTSFRVSGLTLIGSGIRHASTSAIGQVTDEVDGVVIKQADELGVILNFSSSSNSSLTVENSTFTDNHSNGASGVAYLLVKNEGDLSFRNNTVVNNSFSESMIASWSNNSGSGQVISNTIVENEISTYPDVYDRAFEGVSLFGNIIANLNLNGSEMCSSVSEQGANLFDVQPSGCLPLQPVGQPPLTLPTAVQTDGSSAVIADIADTLSTSLALNGGTTPTLGLLSGSPAIDYYKQGDDGALGTFPTTDQRAVGRPIGAGYDVGAFEYQEIPTNTVDSESLADTGLNEQNTYLELGALGALAIVGGTLGLAARRRKS